MSPSRALSPLSRALLLACLGGPVLVSAGSACAAEIRTDAASTTACLPSRWSRR